MPHHRDTEDTEDIDFSLAGRPARLARPPRLLGWRAGLSESDGGQATAREKKLCLRPKR
jgi:hypothetical protein